MTSTNLREKNKQYDRRKMLISFLLLYLPYFMLAQPIIVATKINGKTRQLGNQQLTLKALEDDLIFEFQPSNDSFAFFLDNFDAQPIKTSFPTIRYTHLQGGNYTLNYWTEKNNAPSAKGQIELYVEESLAETWWFYPSLIFYGLLIIGAIIYFWTIYNLQQKIKIQNIRNRIARDLHDQVGADLGSIAIFVRAIERRMHTPKFDVLPILKDIQQTADETIINLKDTVWMINPKNDDMEQLFEKIRSFAAKILALQNINLIYDNQLTRPLKISMEQRYNAYMICKEAVNNIVKHAKATEVKITIIATKEGVSFEICDNGKGFDPSVLSEGNGLENFKRRAEESFFEFSIHSEMGKGTCLKLLIPEL